MKHKILIVLGGIFLVFLVVIYYEESSYNVLLDSNKTKIKNDRMLSLMLETEAKSGQYEMTTSSSWPTDGYVFNSELSKCENGGILSWDEKSKKVLFEGNNIDKCYVYFDVYVPPTIADYCGSGDTLTTCFVNFAFLGSDKTLVYHHDSTLENGAEDNSYRYAGSNEEVKNFVCFGSDAENCPVDNLYRIIGLVNGKLKLVKYDYATTDLLGTDGDYGTQYKINIVTYKGVLTNNDEFYWNNVTKTNTWSESLLNKTNLNTNFINNIGNLWADKIAMVTWKVGGNSYVNLSMQTAKVTYQNEIVNPVTTNTTDNLIEYTAKVGLIYISDYLYALSANYWSNPNASDIGNVNWMYMGLNEWTITRRSDFSGLVMSINYRGYRDYDGYMTGSTNGDLGVRPSFYLESSVTYVSGDGSINLPIRIN